MESVNNNLSDLDKLLILIEKVRNYDENEKEKFKKKFEQSMESDQVGQGKFAPHLLNLILNIAEKELKEELEDRCVNNDPSFYKIKEYVEKSIPISNIEDVNKGNEKNFGKED